MKGKRGGDRRSTAESAILVQRQQSDRQRRLDGEIGVIQSQGLVAPLLSKSIFSRSGSSDKVFNSEGVNFQLDQDRTSMPNTPEGGRSGSSRTSMPNTPGSGSSRTSMPNTPEGGRSGSSLRAINNNGMKRQGSAGSLREGLLDSAKIYDELPILIKVKEEPIEEMRKRNERYKQAQCDQEPPPSTDSRANTSSTKDESTNHSSATAGIGYEIPPDIPPESPPINIAQSSIGTVRGAAATEHNVIEWQTFYFEESTTPMAMQWQTGPPIQMEGPACIPQCEQPLETCTMM